MLSRAQEYYSRFCKRCSFPSILNSSTLGTIIWNNVCQEFERD
jgi:hypothetical protein